jgi:chemotaxis protein MotB
MALSRRSRPTTINIWPGFVDALTQLTMVIVFLLLVFTVGQFYLSGVVSDRDAEIRKLSSAISKLGDMLALEKTGNADLKASIVALEAQLHSVTTERDALLKSHDDLAAQLGGLQSAAAAKDARLQQEDAEVAALNQNIDELRQQLSAIAAALDLAQTKARAQDAEIVDLGDKLNLALVRKVNDLAGYRSEFFGKLRQIIGDRQDIRVVGDRFVFQAEVLFAPGEATLGAPARKRLIPVVAALREIEGKIPDNIHWILEIDGHTDRTPIDTPVFHSNWELANARALSVVKFLISQGIPASHLAAAGFGEFQPLDSAKTPDAYRKNRRIELKLTQF